MTASEAPPPEASRFSIFYTGAGPGDNEGWLVNELRSIEGCDGYGDGIAVAARGDLRGAVVFTVAAGSAPAAIHKVMVNGPSIGVKAVATGTGFAIIGTSPATYDGFVEAIGLEAYGGGIAPPVRREIGDNGYRYPALTCQRLPAGAWCATGVVTIPRRSPRPLHKPLDTHSPRGPSGPTTPRPKTIESWCWRRDTLLPLSPSAISSRG